MSPKTRQISTFSEWTIREYRIQKFKILNDLLGLRLSSLIPGLDVATFKDSISCKERIINIFATLTRLYVLFGVALLV